jgi:fructose-1-phosphate kinase PfkB-like protein
MEGFNVSPARVELGENSVVMGFVDRIIGERLAAELRRMGIGMDFVRVVGDTRTKINIVTELPSRYIMLNESGPTVNLEGQHELIKKTQHLARPGGFWVLSGSLPPGVSHRMYADMIHEVQSEDAKAMLIYMHRQTRLDHVKLMQYNLCCNYMITRKQLSGKDMSMSRRSMWVN